MHRYLKTFAHVCVWHLTDVWDHVTPSLGNKSVAVIRKAHMRVARAMDARFPNTTVSLRFLDSMLLKQIYTFRTRPKIH